MESVVGEANNDAPSLNHDSDRNFTHALRTAMNEAMADVNLPASSSPCSNTATPFTPSHYGYVTEKKAEELGPISCHGSNSRSSITNESWVTVQPPDTPSPSRPFPPHATDPEEDVL